MGDLVAFSAFRERRRSRETRRLHEVCREILAASSASPPERAVRLRRLHKFEDAHAYAATMG